MIRSSNYRLSTILSQRCEIWRRTWDETKNELGQYPAKDVCVDVVYCGVIPQTGSLLAGREADTTLSRTTHKIILRFRPNFIKSGDWFIINGERYNVLYIMNPYENRERLEVFTEVVV